MSELFITSDIITYVLAYIAQATRALRDECKLSLLEYRMLAYLDDHVDGIAPSMLANVLRVTPAAITAASGKLAEQGLVTRGATGKAASHLSISKRGIDSSRDADLVIALAHEEYFAPLPPHLKAMIDIGSIVTNQSSPDGMRIREGHFFSAFETLHAFLIVERFFTISSHEFGLSLTQFRVLLETHRQGGTALPGTLSNVLLLAPPTVTYAIHKLEEDDLVYRIQSRADARRVALAMTDAGRNLFAKALASAESVLTTDIRSSTRRERDAYKDAAMIMVSSLRKRQAKRYMSRINQPG